MRAGLQQPLARMILEQLRPSDRAAQRVGALVAGDLDQLETAGLVSRSAVFTSEQVEQGARPAVASPAPAFPLLIGVVVPRVSPAMSGAIARKALLLPVLGRLACDPGAFRLHRA